MLLIERLLKEMKISEEYTTDLIWSLKYHNLDDLENNLKNIALNCKECNDILDLMILDEADLQNICSKLKLEYGVFINEFIDLINPLFKEYLDNRSLKEFIY